MQQTTPLVDNMRARAGAQALRGYGLRALILDKVDERLLSGLLREGVDVVSIPEITRKELLEAIPPFHIVIGRTRLGVDAQIMERGKKLQIIGRASVGVENIDTAEATRRGIEVITAAGASTESVAQLALALTIAGLRDTHGLASQLANGEFEKLEGRELGETVTVGIVGLGRIGYRFAQFLQVHGVNLLAHDVVDISKKTQALGADSVGLERLLMNSDVVSLHVSMEANSPALIGAGELGIMRKGVVLINTVRAAAVDMYALSDALRIGTVGFYGSDVPWSEKPKERGVLEEEILNRRNVVMTPHIGAQTVEAQAKVADVMVPRLVEVLAELER